MTAPRPCCAEAGRPVRRLIVVPCGGQKTTDRISTAAGMYTGSYHRLARRAADALCEHPDDRVVILSGFYGLICPGDVIGRYDIGFGSGDWREQNTEGLARGAASRGLLDADEVIVLAGKRYADKARQIWPHAQTPLEGVGGIGHQRAVLAAIARREHDLAA